MLTAIIVAAITADAKAQNSCRDKELEVACKSALEAADELLNQKSATAIYLESQLKIQMSQNDQAQKLIVDLTNPPWYSDYRYTFLIGIITGGLLHGTLSK